MSSIRYSSTINTTFPRNSSRNILFISRIKIFCPFILSISQSINKNIESWERKSHVRCVKMMLLRSIVKLRMHIYVILVINCIIPIRIESPTNTKELIYQLNQKSSAVVQFIPMSSYNYFVWNVTDLYVWIARSKAITVLDRCSCIL